MSENNNSFMYPNGIEEIAEKMGHRSNSIASTYLCGMQSRKDDSIAAAFAGAIVLLNIRRSSASPFIGTPLDRDMFEKMAFKVKMLYSGEKCIIGEVTTQDHDEFVVQSSNWIGNYFQFSVLGKKGEI